MYSQTTELNLLKVTLTAHGDPLQKLLLASLTAGDQPESTPHRPATIAVVIDRSGSMSGKKLSLTLAAVERLIRSLLPDDRIAVVTYDAAVGVVAGLSAPSDAMARAVGKIECGDSTNLYGGWVTGAKLVGAGGRVVLLSDGLANVGRFTDAANLAAHAAISYKKFGVTTTTIGIGEDYDEGLMAGMARAGGGAHYFASTAEAVLNAFSQERFSIGSMVLSSVSVRFQGITKQLGCFWAGETKSSVFCVRDLAGSPATVRYATSSDGKVETCELSMPRDFGHSDEATFEMLMEEVADLEDRALSVRDPRSAASARESLRNVLLRIMGHPLADSPLALAVRDRLDRSIAELVGLEQHFDEREATIHRKRSMQAGFNVRERGKAFSSFAEDNLSITVARETAMELDPEARTLDRTALVLAPIEQWRRWRALPIARRGRTIVVVVENPRDGFLLAEIEGSTGRRVRFSPQAMSAEEILRELK